MEQINNQQQEENESIPVFKVGDKVRLKPGISHETHYSDPPHFLYDMERYIGCIGEITSVTNKGNYKISFSGYGEGWSFSPRWLEKA